METKMVQQALLNLPVAADVSITAIPGKIIIKGLKPYNTVDHLGVDVFTALAEVRQVVTIAVPTIVASTKYAFGAFNSQNSRENWNQRQKKVGATSAAVLAAAVVDGNSAALIDKYNIMISWAYKFNNMQLYAKAGAAITVVHAVTTAPAGGFAVGNIVTGTTSGARAIVRVSGATTGTWSVISGRFTATEALTDNAGNASASLTSWTVTGNFVITDDAGYFPANGTRQGKNSVVAGVNIPASAITITTAAVYGRGIGARMLQDVPVMEITTNNIATGILGFPTNEAPVVGNTYTFVIIRYRPLMDDSAMSPAGGIGELNQGLYLYDGAAGYAATLAALQALPL